MYNSFDHFPYRLLSIPGKLAPGICPETPQSVVRGEVTKCFSWRRKHGAFRKEIAGLKTI